ncbi:MAG: N-acetyl-alpha-D-glucosaminyl L-malate synthase BshA [Bacteroidetes bacterium]|nr:N-acetyl-alpha-D-glucosaminyl L-malate synthase BshA [Bacteroidota bacterium]NCQ11143.1 N-acetyl-alpha-D-glucosaminyl L-malate synthase BshA [Bacteroidota bacterium]
MNIGMVCYPTYGGSGVVATELGKGLAEKGHKVHFMSYAKPMRLNEFQANIMYHEVSVNAYPLFEYPPYDLALASNIVDLVKYENLDLIHVHYAIPHATSAYLAKQILGERGRHIPLITTLHGTDITVVGSSPSYLPVVNFSINQSDGVTAVSEYLKEETYSRFEINNEIRVVPNFVDIERFQHSDKNHFKKAICPNGEFIIAHVSNFRKVKRVEDCVRVFRKVLDSGIKAKLLLVGDGPERESVEAFCRELGTCQHTLMLGKQEKIEEILSIADVFLLPSASETFGLAALEAMSCKVPVVSSNIGGIPELNVHDETGYLCNLGDAEAMANYTVQILNNEELRTRLSKNARKHAETFEISHIISQYENYYEEVSENLQRKLREKEYPNFI